MLNTGTATASKQKSKQKWRSCRSYYFDTQRDLAGAMMPLDRSCVIEVGPNADSELQNRANGWKWIIVATEDLKPGDRVFIESTFVVYDRDTSARKQGAIPEDAIKCAIVKAEFYGDGGKRKVLDRLRPLPQRSAASEESERHEEKESDEKNMIADDIWNVWSNSVLIKPYREDKLSYLTSSWIHRGPSSETSQLPETEAHHDQYALYFKLSLMPHSCSPNTAISLIENEKVAVYALKHIKAGEPLTRSWMNNLLCPREQRSSQFQTQFDDDDCSCDVCRACDEDPMFLGMDDWVRIVMDEKRRLLVAQRRHFNTMKVMKTIEELIKLQEHMYDESFCSILSLIKLYMQTATIVGNEQPDKVFLQLRQAAGYAQIALGPENIETIGLVRLSRERGLDMPTFERLPIGKLKQLGFKARMERLCCLGLLEPEKLKLMFGQGGTTTESNSNSNNQKKSSQLSQPSFLTRKLSLDSRSVSGSGSGSGKTVRGGVIISFSPTGDGARRKSGNEPSSPMISNDDDNTDAAGIDTAVIISERRRSLGAGMVPYIPPRTLAEVERTAAAAAEEARHEQSRCEDERRRLSVGRIRRRLSAPTTSFHSGSSSALQVQSRRSSHTGVDILGALPEDLLTITTATFTSATAAATRSLNTSVTMIMSPELSSRRGSIEENNRRRRSSGGSSICSDIDPQQQQRSPVMPAKYDSASWISKERCNGNNSSRVDKNMTSFPTSNTAPGLTAAGRTSYSGNSSSRVNDTRVSSANIGRDRASSQSSQSSSPLDNENRRRLSTNSAISNSSNSNTSSSSTSNGKRCSYVHSPLSSSPIDDHGYFEDMLRGAPNHFSSAETQQTTTPSSRRPSTAINDERQQQFSDNIPRRYSLIEQDVRKSSTSSVLPNVFSRRPSTADSSSFSSSVVAPPVLLIRKRTTSISDSHHTSPENHDYRTTAVTDGRVSGPPLPPYFVDAEHSRHLKDAAIALQDQRRRSVKTIYSQICPISPLTVQEQVRRKHSAVGGGGSSNRL